MENHILRLTFCSAAVIDDDSRVSAFNMLGEKMTLERSSGDENNSTDNEINTTSESSMNILVNGKSRMLEEDLMAIAGVLHVSFLFIIKCGKSVSLFLKAYHFHLISIILFFWEK
jgi:hypothetical protein